MSVLIRRVIGSNGVLLQTLKSMPLRCLGSTARQSAADSSSDVPASTRPDAQKLITVEGHEDLAVLSPSDELKTRQIRIYQPAKNAMQSGTDNLRCWHLDFDTQQRWENPLMGWTSSADPMSNMQMEFDTKEDAIMFCQKNGWEFSVDTKAPLKPKVKSYGANYSWNKRTRTSTK